MDENKSETCSRAQALCQTLDKPSGHYFNQPGHTQSHLAGLVLEHVKILDPFVLKAREFYLIQKFDTYNNGLNKEPWVWAGSARYNLL